MACGARPCRASSQPAPGRQQRGAPGWQRQPMTQAEMMTKTEMTTHGGQQDDAPPPAALPVLLRRQLRLHAEA